MKEFVMIFRSEPMREQDVTPDKIQAMMTAWQSWMGSLSAQGKLASMGNRAQGRCHQEGG